MYLAITFDGILEIEVTSSERDCGAILVIRLMTWSTLVVTLCLKSAGFILLPLVAGPRFNPSGRLQDQDRSSSRKNMAN